MNTFIAAGILVLLTQGGGSGSAAQKPFSLNFSQTDVSQIFRVIGMRTGTNIIYAGGDKVAVTLHFTAENADEAIRATSAAAGLVFRQVGKFYVVAKPGGLRQALIPFSEKERIKTSEPTTMAKLVGDLLPDTTVIAGDGEIVVQGVLYDLKVAERIVSEHPPAGKDPRIVDVVTVHSTTAAKIGPVLTELYPEVKVTVLNDKAGGGSIAFFGLPEDVDAAKKKALELDAAASSATAANVVESYDVKYAGARMVVDFLKQVVPGVNATLAPSAYIPPDPNAGGGSSFGTIKSSGTQTGPGGAAGAGATGAGGGGGQNTGAEGGGTAGAGGTGATSPGDGTYNPPTRILLSGPGPDVQLALAFIAKVDTKPKQVSIEVRVVDASPKDLDNLGIKYTWDPLKFFDMPPGSTAASATTTTAPVGLGQISRLPIGLNALLDTMVSHTDSKLLANPSIQVIDNQEADFFIGDQLSFPVTTGGALGTQNVSIERFQVGVALNVRPRVSPDGTVIMNINPIIQTLTGITNGLPQTASREARTTVMVKDNETVIIGGLIRDEDTKTIEQIPLLSKLPLVGQLFRHSSRDHRRSNVIVTITPHIVPDKDIPK